MQLKGMEFAFDFTDAEDLERYEKAYEKLQQSISCTNKDTPSQAVRRQCAATKAFFDTVLGEGAYEKLVDKPTSALANSDVLWDFMEAYQREAETVEKQQRQRLDKFKKYTAGRRRT